MIPFTRIPVTLLTGFLGSGKTTVLNRFLAQGDIGQTAVIVNEFGEIGLDHELVVSDTENMVLLQSGCMCCALRGDLLDTLEELLDLRTSGDVAFDRIVIETSGLATPAPILHTILTDPVLADALVVDGVVTTVDAANGSRTLEVYEEAQRQVALADLVLLTKTDLAEASAAYVRTAIAELNASAPIHVVANGRVNPEDLIGLRHFDLGMSADQVADWMRIEAVPSPHRRAADAAVHLDAIRSVSFAIESPITANQFDFWMELLMARRGSDLLRVKGLIHLADVPYPFVVHGVQHIFHPPILLKDWQGSDRRTKFVMILRDFTDPEVEDLVQALTSFPVTDHALVGGYLSAEPIA